MKINDFKDEELNFGILLILMPYCAYSKKEIIAQYGYKEIKKISRTRGCYSVEYYFNDLIEELYRKVTAWYCYSMKIYKVDSESKWMVGAIKASKNEIFSASVLNHSEVRQLAKLNEQYDESQKQKKNLQGTYSDLKQIESSVFAENVATTSISDCFEGLNIVIQSHESNCETVLAQIKNILGVI